MKRFLICLAAAVLLSFSAVSAEDGVKILIDGEMLFVSGQQPVIENGVTMVPFRSIFEGLGAYVDWIPETKSIVAAKGLTVIKMQINSDSVLVNGEMRTIAAAPALMNDTTMVPVRAMSELLDSEVDWNRDSKTVSVTTEKKDFDHEVKTVYYTDKLSAPNGDELLKITVAYPVFEKNGSDAVDKINLLYRTQAKEFAAEAKRQFGDGLNSDYQAAAAEGKSFEPMSLLYGYEVAFDKFGFLSLVEQAEIAGGEVFYFDAVTFDSGSAEILKKSDFLNLSDDQEASLEPYSFYLYGDQVILYLNSNNMHLYYYYDYPPTMAIQDEYVKYDLSTGEEKISEQTSARSEDTGRTFSKIYELNNAAGFEMAELKNQVQYVPDGFVLLDGGVGAALYIENGTGTKVTLKKSRGDSDISGIAGSEKLEEEAFEGCLAEYYKTENEIYSCFSIKKDDGIYSYSVIISDPYQENKLKSLTEEIISGETDE